MATITFSNNTENTHVVIDTPTDQLVLPKRRVGVGVNPYSYSSDDYVRLMYDNDVVLEFDPAVTNLVGATLALKVADLVDTYLSESPVIMASVPGWFTDSDYPSDPPYYIIDHAKYETAAATDTFDHELLSNFGGTECFVQVVVHMQAFEPTSATPIDEEIYETSFYTGTVAAGLAHVARRVNATARSNYINTFDWDGTNLEFNVVCGSSPTTTRFEVQLDVYVAANTA